jgi:cation:H+ antiporter
VDILSILFGLVILYFGGESLIAGSISVARNLNISKILVSSVIVGFGTSMPEMTVSIGAVLKDSPEIAIGNVIGSNIANILLVLGVAATISPICLKKDDLNKKDVLVMLISTIILCLLGFLGIIGFFEGAIMLIILTAYITYSYLQDKKNFSKKDVEEVESDMGFANNLNLPLSAILSLAGIILLIIGSSLFLDGSIGIAERFNISKEVIGLGIVAIGSSLPELTTSIVASIKKHGNIVVAGIVGSNIFNILSIVGVLSMLEAISIPTEILRFDLWIFLSTTIILSFMLLRGIRLGRNIGLIFLTAYVSYFYVLFFY